MRHTLITVASKGSAVNQIEKWKLNDICGH